MLYSGGAAIDETVEQCTDAADERLDELAGSVVNTVKHTVEGRPDKGGLTRANLPDLSYLEDSAQQYLEQQLHGAEPVDGGVTNPVYRTADETYLKQFSDGFNGSALRYAASQLRNAVWHYPSAAERMDKEEWMKDVVSETVLEAPEVLERYANWLEVDAAPGEPVKDFVADAASQDAYWVGHQIGSGMRELHDDHYALIDNRLDNYKIDETTGQVHHFDDEFAKTWASGADLETDALMLLSSAHHLPPEQSTAFVDGVEDGYGEPFPDRIQAASVVTSLGHAALVEPSRDWFRNAVANGKTVFSRLSP